LNMGLSLECATGGLDSQYIPRWLYKPLVAAGQRAVLCTSRSGPTNDAHGVTHPTTRVDHHEWRHQAPCRLWHNGTRPVPPLGRAPQHGLFVQPPVPPGHSTYPFGSSYDLLSGFRRIIPTIKSYLGSDGAEMSG
jgi:hypothetical protein